MSHISLYTENQDFSKKEENPFVRDKRTIIKCTEEKFNKYFCGVGTEIVRKELPNSNFVIDSFNEKSIRQIYYYLTHNEKFDGDLHKGLLSIGAVGCGKTTINRVITRIIRDVNRMVITEVRAKSLVDVIKDGQIQISSYYKIPLSIEDVGRDAGKVVDYGTSRNPMIEILDGRYESGAFTLATSNFRLITLAKKYSDSPEEITEQKLGYIGDRIKSMFNIIHIEGETRRK